MEINIGSVRSVKGSQADYHLEVDSFDFMDSQWQLAKPLVADVHLTHQGQFIGFTAHVQTAVVSNCDRCLVQVTIPVELDITEQLLYANDVSLFSHLAIGEVEEKYYLYYNDTLDIADMVREYILAQKVVCQDDCRGLCPACGQNLNQKQCQCDLTEIDPRLAILAKLKATEEV